MASVQSMPVLFHTLLSVLMDVLYKLYSSLTFCLPLCASSPLPSVICGKDPSAVAVLMEDSAAVAGVLLTSASILLTHSTGNTCDVLCCGLHHHQRWVWHCGHTFCACSSCYKLLSLITNFRVATATVLSCFASLITC